MFRKLIKVLTTLALFHCSKLPGEWSPCVLIQKISQLICLSQDCKNEVDIIRGSIGFE